MRSRSLALLPVFVAALAFTARSAHAETIDQTYSHDSSYSGTSVGISDQDPGTDPGLIFTFQKFDPALGTLNDIRLTLTGSEESGVVTITSYRDYSDPEDATIGIHGQLHLGNYLTVGLESGLFNYVVPGGGGHLSGIYASPFPVGPLDAPGNAGSASVTLSSPQDLATFTGPGTTSLNLSQFTLLYGDTPDSDAGASASPDMALHSQPTVSYDYTPVAAPEPSTWALAGLGIPALLGRSRRRSRRT